jgi:iron complex transport system permease protein
VARARFAAAALAAWLSGAAVALAGLVGFIGLVVPNAVRLLVGPRHRVLLTSCALGGAALMLLADTAARTIAAPIELPVGALLALLGGPTFTLILRRQLS